MKRFANPLYDTMSETRKGFVTRARKLDLSTIDEAAKGKKAKEIKKEKKRRKETITGRTD